MRGLHPSDELETRRDFAEKSTRPQVPGGHSPLVPNPSCSSSSSSSVLKSPLARISIDQPQEEKGNQDPRNALYQEQTSRRSESNSVRGGVCALDWEGARDRRRPTGPVIVAPIPHPKDPRCWKEGGRGGGASLSTPAPIPKLPTPFGSDGQLFRRGQRAGTERRCWRCECISIETTESSSSLVFAASPLRGGGEVRERKGRQTGPAGAWILGLLPARNKCQSLFFSGAVRFGKVVKASWSRAVVAGSAIVGICDRGDAPREAGEGCRSPCLQWCWC